MDTVLSATLFGAEDLRMVEQPLGALEPGMVRVRFGAGGICGSDMHYFRHGRTGDFVVTSPLVLGHEIAGEIVELAADTKELKLGDRVAVNPSRWCGHCARCREGRQNLCENIYFMGSASKTPHMQGGFATYFDAVPAQCVKVADHTPIEAAALAEPLAVCLHAVNRAGPVEGRRGIVFGAGPIGLLTFLAARMAGMSEVAVVDVAAAPLTFAKRLGADHIVDLSAGGGAFERARGGEVFRRCLRGLRHRRRSVVGDLERAARRHGRPDRQPAGWAAPGAGQRGHGQGDRSQGLVPVRPGVRASRPPHRREKIDVLSIVTSQRPLSEAPEGFRLALDRSQSVKVVLTAL